MGTAGAGEGHERLEHEHEVVELGPPFAQVFGPEIVDANLSDFEFRLLVYLRITAATNGSTWVSHRQMAKHLGKTERTVKWAYSELREKGFAKSQKRSWAQSSRKILVAPLKIYKTERMRNFFRYLRPDTMDEDIAFLRRRNLDSSETSSEVIYFMRSGDMVKIGLTGDIERRVRAIQASSPLPVDLLATVPGGLSKEWELHSRFSAHRQHGEWFRLGKEIQRYLEELDG